jgi:hypothetical protein
VRDLGISLGQGYFMGRPIPSPRVAIESEAAEVLGNQRVSVMPAMRTTRASGRRRELQTIDAPTVVAQATHHEVDQLFDRPPNLHAVAIVDQGVPIGLIDRRQFMERYAKRYFKELYAGPSRALRSPICRRAWSNVTMTSSSWRAY